MLRSLAITGAAGLAAVLGIAPAASAAVADDIAPDATGEPSPRSSATAEAGKAAAEAEAPVKAALAGDFGEQKFRIGVQIDDGSWVPPGTNTVGSTFTITKTGPNVEDNNGTPVAGGTYTFTCTTLAGSGGGSPGEENEERPDPKTSRFCDDGVSGGGVSTPAAKSSASAVTGSSVSAAAVTTGVTVDPDESSDHQDQYFTVEAGTAVTITQKTAGTNLVMHAGPAVVGTCELGEFDNRFCPGKYDPTGGDANTKFTTVLFTNIGLPPVAVDDVRTTSIDTPIDIDVLTNDDTVRGAPLTGLVTVTPPNNGTARVKGTVPPVTTPTPTPSPTPTPTPTPTPSPTEGAVGQVSVRAAATGPVITYHPSKGFSGKDTFTYTLSTPNGTATAKVTITIPPLPADADDPDDPADPVDNPETDTSGGPLPNVGGFDAQLLAWGVTLIAGGGYLTAVGRQRPRGRHALVD